MFPFLLLFGLRMPGTTLLKLHHNIVKRARRRRARKFRRSSARRNSGERHHDANPSHFDCKNSCIWDNPR
jgi:hypothetical protein